MHWSEDLIVGGVRRNQSGHIVRAEALQSVLLLLGEQQLYEKYAQDIKTANIDWTVEKAKAILQAWHRKFTQVGIQVPKFATILLFNEEAFV